MTDGRNDGRMKTSILPTFSKRKHNKEEVSWTVRLDYSDRNGSVLPWHIYKSNRRDIRTRHHPNV